MSECEPIEVDIYKTARRAETFLCVHSRQQQFLQRQTHSQVANPTSRG